MVTRIQLRRGTAAQWTAANPTLSAGEVGVELDTLRIKVGNGTTAWNALAYLVGGGGAVVLDDLTDVSTAGAATGDALVYNGALWVPVAHIAGGGGVSAIASMTQLAYDAIPVPSPTTLYIIES